MLHSPSNKRAYLQTQATRRAPSFLRIPHNIRFTPAAAPTSSKQLPRATHLHRPLRQRFAPSLASIGTCCSISVSNAGAVVDLLHATPPPSKRLLRRLRRRLSRPLNSFQCMNPAGQATQSRVHGPVLLHFWHAIATPFSVGFRRVDRGYQSPRRDLGRRDCHSRTSAPASFGNMFGSTFRCLFFLLYSQFRILTPTPHASSYRSYTRLAAMEESEYFHATLYQFNTVSRDEIIKRLNHADNNVSAKCWYNADLQVSRVSTTFAFAIC